MREPEGRERPQSGDTRSGRAYALLRGRILDLRFGPDRVLTLAEITRDLGISRTPAREALARLAREGLVTSEPRRGYRVTPITIKDARDLFGLRTLLEGEAAALAARHGGDIAHLRELDELCHAQYEPTDATSIARFLDANAQFHLAVAELGGNDRLTGGLREVIDSLERYMHLGLSLIDPGDEIVHEHRDLLTAIMASDSARAHEVARAQAQASHRMVLDALLATQAVVNANLGGPKHRDST